MLTRTDTLHPLPLFIQDGNDRAFFYVDGVPINGTWIDLDSVDCWDDVLAALHRAGIVRSGYGGDIQVADVEGPLAGVCYSPRLDSLDLNRYLELRSDVEEYALDAGAVAAFVDWYGSWDCDAFQSAYMGEHESEEAFAEQFLDDAGILEQIPENLRSYFDVERFAADLFMGDYYYAAEGYVFCCNC